RFKLKGHHVSREISVYNLIVAKSRSKPQPFQERSCTANDFLLNPFPPPLAPDSRLTRKGPNWRLDMEATSVDDFCGLLRLDFPIVNKAGITGLFDLHFEYAMDEAAGNISEAVVIDHIERPSGN